MKAENSMLSRIWMYGCQHCRFGLLIITFIFISRLYAIQIPPFETFDEYEHFAYVTHVRETGALPYPPNDATGAIRQQSASPPLYYTFAAIVNALHPAELVPPQYNDWLLSDQDATSPNNQYMFLMNPDQHILDSAESNMSASLVLTRNISLLFGVLALVGMYLAGLALWEHQRPALLAVSLLAFNPMFLQLTNAVSNDIAAIAFSALMLAFSFNLFQHWQSWHWVVTTGIVMGLAALTKANALTMWLIPVLALTLTAWPIHKNWKQISLRLSVMIGVAIAIGGWWYLRSWLLFNDPFGFWPHQQQAWSEGANSDLPTFIDNFPDRAREAWANFGTGATYMSDWAYIVPLIVIALGLSGFVRVRTERRMLIPLASVLLGLISLFRWAQVSSVVPGRLLLPYATGFIILVVWGLVEYPKLIYSISIGALGIVAVFGGLMTLPMMFGIPTDADFPDINLLREPVAVNADGTAKLTAVHFDPSTLEGDLTTATLCWKANSASTYLDMQYPFSIQVLSPDRQEVIGRRESYTGMGRYTRWRRDYQFCDTFNIPLSATEPGTAYPVQLNFFPYGRTSEESFPSLSIGHVWRSASQAPQDQIETASIMFESILLLDYDVQMNRSQIRVEFEWSTLNQLKHEYFWFLHIYTEDTDELRYEANGPLGSSKYPSFAWQHGELIPDSGTIALTDVEPGSYRLELGIFNPIDGMRLPAYFQNEHVEVNSLLLFSFEIN